MDLSVIIPARNEMFLKHTIDHVLANARANTEVIAICDGNWPLEAIPDHPQVRMVYHPTSIGQRAATNEGARISDATYIMKLDAHCAVDEGFDVKLMAHCEYDWTVIPRMYNLHAFDRVCRACGHRAYQGPTVCEKCESTDIEREIVWKPRLSRMTDFARFDKTLHFQYWGAYKTRDAAQGDIADTMSSVGACFFMHRQRFWDLGGLDEAHGSWGQFGVEVACKAFLSGGRHVVNKTTWFAHMFRTQGGDFGFPYPISGRQVERARQYSRDLWQNNKWPLATRKFQDLIDFYAPIPDWHEDVPSQVGPAVKDRTETVATVKKSAAPATPAIEVTPIAQQTPVPALANPTKGILYYTDNRLDGTAIGMSVQYQLLQSDLPITSVSLKPIEFGSNLVLPLERGYLTMARQILAGLEAMTTDVVFFCEHDVLYHPTHFAYTPADRNVYYYNLNVWKVNAQTGHAVTYITKQLSGLCAYRDRLLAHYRERVRRIETEGFSRKMGFEPGSHGRAERVDDFPSDVWRSEFPNIDIRHDKNLTESRWSQEQFRNKRSCEGWTESDRVPGWGKIEGRFDAWLDAVSSSLD